jgi:hypothetical protein
MASMVSVTRNFSKINSRVLTSVKQTRGSINLRARRPQEQNSSTMKYYSNFLMLE